MKKIIGYFKDTILTGIVLVVPIAVTGIILADALKKIIEVTTPLTKRFAVGGVITETLIVVITVVVVLAVLCFIAGIFYHTFLGHHLEKWLENEVLVHIPFFKTLKGLTKQITGIDKANYPVVEVDLQGNKNKSLGLLTDTLTDGRCVVYVPFSPIINIGQVYIVLQENVKKLDMSIKDATDIITQIGFEANKVYKT